MTISDTNIAPVVAPSAAPAPERRRWAVPVVIGAAVAAIVLSGATAFFVHSEVRRLGGWETDVIRRENEAKSVLDQRDQIKKDIEALRGQRHAEQLTLEKLRADVADLSRQKGERDRAELDVQEARKKVLELEAALKAAMSQRDEAVAGKKRLESEVSDLQTRKSGLEKDIPSLSRDRQKLADDMAKAQDDIQRSKQALEDTTARLRKAEADLSRTTEDLTKQRQQAQEAEDRRITADLATKAAQQQEASAKDAAHYAETRTADAEKLFKDLDAKARDARKTIDELRSVEAALNSRIGPLQSQVQTLDKAIPPRKDELKALEDAVANLKTQKAGLEASVEHLKPVIDQMRADQANSATLERARQDVEVKLASAQAELTRIQADLQKTEGQKSTSGTDLARLQSLLEAARRDGASAEAAGRARAETEKLALAARADLTRLQDDLAASLARKNDLETTIKRLEDQAAKVKIDDAAAQASDARRKDVETSVKQIRDEQTRAERELMDAKARLADTIQRRAILDGELSELIRRRDEVRSSLPSQSPIATPNSEPSNVNRETKP